jgi:hypothetical protein
VISNQKSKTTSKGNLNLFDIDSNLKRRPLTPQRNAMKPHFGRNILEYQDEKPSNTREQQIYKYC